MASNTPIVNRPPGQTRNYPPPDRTGTISFTPPGITLHCETFYYLWGDLTSSQTPLVCLHGGPGATSAYMKPYSLLNLDFGMPVIMYDQLGCGRSTHLRDRKGDIDFWNIELFVAELQNLLAHFHLTTFDLLGHSWGGQVSCRFAATAPKGLRKLVVANSTAIIGQNAAVQKHQMANLPAPYGDIAREAHRTGNTDTPEYKSAEKESERHYMCRLDPWPQEALDSWAAFEEDDTVSSTMYVLLQRFDLSGDLRLLTAESVPGGMLLMNSKYDQATDELVLPYFMPSAKVKWVRLAESAHLAILDETEAVVAATGQFLTFASVTIG
jgi:proline-specific peptidase